MPKFPVLCLLKIDMENTEWEGKPVVELFDSDFQVSYGATKSQFFELINNPTKLSYYFLPRITHQSYKHFAKRQFLPKRLNNLMPHGVLLCLENTP